MGDRSREIEAAARIVSESRHIVAFCGAGISAESGISTFRDPGGLWDQIDPWEAGTPSGLLQAIESKSEVLKPIFNDIISSFRQAEPNPGHEALARLEEKGKLQVVITQNVDDLHTEAGSKRVIEVHGNLFRMRCLSCSATRKLDRKAFIEVIKLKFEALTSLNLEQLVSLMPRCDQCGNAMRPDVVMFGEAVQGLRESFQEVQNCDAMLVLGTSGVVYPVAEFPSQAKRRGASIIVINPTENAFPDVSDVYIPMKTGLALPLILDQVR